MPSEPQSLLAKIALRFERSSRVFLLMLATLCLVEIAVDWNSTLYEINVLRGDLRRKAQSYADVLRKAAERAIVTRNPAELRLLSTGLFDDTDTVFVRFVAADESSVYEELRPSYAAEFERRHHSPFREHYAYVMSRDVHGMLTDPRGLQSRMLNSRHRDLVQVFTDGEDHLLARLLHRTPGDEPPPHSLYQDRLADRAGTLDRDLTYALGVISTSDVESPTGVVLIAFRADPLNSAIRGKLLKGLAVTLFFLLLILVQNVLGRRSKLRLLDLESVLAAARTAVRNALPAAASSAAWSMGLAFRQAEKLGGTVYDLRAGERVELLLLSPRDQGVALAFAALQLRDQYRRARAALPTDAPVSTLVGALLGELGDGKSMRGLSFVLFTIERTGLVQGVVAGRAAPCVVEAGSCTPLPLSSDGEPDARLLGTPASFSIELGPRWLALIDDGTSGATSDAFPTLAAKLESETIEAAVDEVVASVVRHARGRAIGDTFAFAVRRVAT